MTTLSSIITVVFQLLWY